jgi:ParB-like chromosome segregation protein Spo0J
MELREIVVDENMTILGGNMRYRAMQDLGIKECPVKIATGLTEEQKREFVIKDNLSYGEWDMDELANNWDDKLLEDWGFEMPDWGNLENEKETKELIDFNRSHILISYNPSKHIELQDILTELMKISGIEIELSSN